MFDFNHTGKEFIVLGSTFDVMEYFGEIGRASASDPARDKKYAELFGVIYADDEPLQEWYRLAVSEQAKVFLSQFGNALSAPAVKMLERLRDMK